MAGYTKRVHPELGCDQRTGHWFITGSNAYRVRKIFSDAGACFYRDEGLWYFPLGTDPKWISLLCDRSNYELEMFHFKDPKSGAGRKRARDAERDGIDLHEMPEPPTDRLIDKGFPPKKEEIGKIQPVPYEEEDAASKIGKKRALDAKKHGIDIHEILENSNKRSKIS